jgi:predicted nucleotidyltransferase
MENQRIFEQIKAEIRLDYPSAEFILFGSRARKNDVEPFSDWDILILIEDDLTEKQKIEIHNKLYEIELRMDQIISAIIHTQKEWCNPSMKKTSFYQNVVRDSELADIPF